MRAQLWERMLVRGHILTDLACRENVCVDKRNHCVNQMMMLKELGRYWVGGKGPASRRNSQVVTESWGREGVLVGSQGIGVGEVVNSQRGICMPAA